jgi:regulator of cell morphogenesis and NO signaling
MDTKKTIAQITTEDYRTAIVFKKYGIDFCCGGKKSLEDACLESNIPIEQITSEIEQTYDNLVNELNYNDWELDYLIDHIIQKHHTFVRKYLPEIDQFLQKTVTKHGEKHPELENVQKLFFQVKQELTFHMQKEEQILFPFIKNMVECKRGNLKFSPAPFGTVKNPIRMMEQEHEEAGDAFKEIRLISNNLQPPENACKSYKITYSLLDEFEKDLHLHIHLENNILFPKSIELEQSFLSPELY